jgi:hypothetical protein
LAFAAQNQFPEEKQERQGSKRLMFEVRVIV